MLINFQVIKSFYESESGIMFLDSISESVQKYLNIKQKVILGIGYIQPFLSNEIIENNFIYEIFSKKYDVSGYVVKRNINFLKNIDIENIPLKKNFCDIIITINTLEYQENIDKSLREIWKCLTTNGKLLIITPSIFNIFNLLDDTPLKLVNKLSEKNLSSKLIENNFYINDIGYHPIINSNFKYADKLSSTIIIDARKKSIIRSFQLPETQANKAFPEII